MTRYMDIHWKNGIPDPLRVKYWKAKLWVLIEWQRLNPKAKAQESNFSEMEVGVDLREETK